MRFVAKATRMRSRSVAQSDRVLSGSPREKTAGQLAFWKRASTSAHSRGARRSISLACLLRSCHTGQTCVARPCSTTVPRRAPTRNTSTPPSSSTSSMRLPPPLLLTSPGHPSPREPRPPHPTRRAAASQAQSVRATASPPARRSSAPGRTSRRGSQSPRRRPSSARPRRACTAGGARRAARAWRAGRAGGAGRPASRASLRASAPTTCVGAWTRSRLLMAPRRSRLRALSPHLGPESLHRPQSLTLRARVARHSSASMTPLEARLARLESELALIRSAASSHTARLDRLERRDEPVEARGSQWSEGALPSSCSSTCGLDSTDARERPAVTQSATRRGSRLLRVARSATGGTAPSSRPSQSRPLICAPLSAAPGLLPPSHQGSD